MKEGVPWWHPVRDFISTECFSGLGMQGDISREVIFARKGCCASRWHRKRCRRYYWVTGRKTYVWGGRSFHGFHREHVFSFNLICRNGFPFLETQNGKTQNPTNGFSNGWECKFFVLEFCGFFFFFSLNLIWSLQDGLWNSMQCGSILPYVIVPAHFCTWFSLLPHHAFSSSPERSHLLTRPDGKHSIFHIEN